MAKYNITEHKDRIVDYQSTINPTVLDELHVKILDKLLVQKKYKDKDYSAKHLAEDLGTNCRYISAAICLKCHTNYASLVNKYRVEEAMTLLVDRRYTDLSMEDVGGMVGFANRQSFYSAFFKVVGCAPRAYKMEYLKAHGMLPAKRRRKSPKEGDAQNKE